MTARTRYRLKWFLIEYPFYLIALYGMRDDWRGLVAILAVAIYGLLNLFEGRKEHEKH